jgi:pimeloyl-ACP methyl ester carboxylesterase
MKRWEVFLGIIGAVLVLVGASAMRRAALPRQTAILGEGGCHTPVTVLEPPPGVNPLGTVILFHGLSANRGWLTYLGADFAGHGFRSYLFDLPGHGENTDPFTFARAERCAGIAVGYLVRSGKISPKTTILLGHSMGAAIAIRMADRAPMAATIAISPAPMITPHRMPSNLLVFSAQYDLGALKRQAESLAEAAGGDRIEPDDFAEQRAFELQKVRFATHTSVILNRRLAHQSEQWAMQTLFPKIAPDTLTRNLGLAAYATRNCGRLAGATTGLLGVLLLFPMCATVAAECSGPARESFLGTYPTRALGLAEGAVSALAAALILAFVVPLKFLHLYAGDYLASLMLLAGMLLIALNWKAAKACLSLDVPRLIAAAALGLATILAVGGWLNWQLDGARLPTPRWLRFAALLPVAAVFCFAEEAILGPLYEGRRRAVRYAMFLALRLELWLACVLAYYKLASGQLLIGLLVVGLAAFSMLQRLAADALLGRTGSATATAVFDAILAAWFIAAIFPLT